MSMVVKFFRTKLFPCLFLNLKSSCELICLNFQSFWFCSLICWFLILHKVPCYFFICCKVAKHVQLDVVLSLDVHFFLKVLALFKHKTHIFNMWNVVFVSGTIHLSNYHLSDSSLTLGFPISFSNFFISILTNVSISSKGLYTVWTNCAPASIEAIAATKNVEYWNHPTPAGILLINTQFSFS